MIAQGKMSPFTVVNNRAAFRSCGPSPSKHSNVWIRFILFTFPTPHRGVGGTLGLWTGHLDILPRSHDNKSLCQSLRINQGECTETREQDWGEIHQVIFLLLVFWISSESVKLQRQGGGRWDARPPSGDRTEGGRWPHAAVWPTVRLHVAKGTAAHGL